MTGHRPVGSSPTIPRRGIRPAACGRRSATCSGSPSTSSTIRTESQEPQVEALGAEYCLGCWRRELTGGRDRVRPRGLGRGFPVTAADRAAGAARARSADEQLARQRSHQTRRARTRACAVRRRTHWSRRGRFIRARHDHGRGWRRLGQRAGDRPDHRRREAPEVPHLVRRAAHEPPRRLPAAGVARIGWVALPRVAS